MPYSLKLGFKSNEATVSPRRRFFGLESGDLLLQNPNLEVCQL